MAAPAGTYASRLPLFLGAKGGPFIDLTVVDPRLGAGVPAPIGSHLIDTVTGAVYDKTGVADTAWSAGGGGGASANDIEVVASTNPSAALGNGIVYVPLTPGADDTLEFQFRATATGNVSLTLLYAMSAANAGDIRLRVDKLAISVGSDPTAALTLGAAFTVTPGNDANLKQLSSVTSAELSMAVTAGDLCRVKLTRLGTDGADTHTADLRVPKPSVVPL